MRLRHRIQYEAGIGTLWNGRAHEKFGRRFQHHLQPRRGDHDNSDNAPNPIDEGRVHGISFDVRFEGAPRIALDAP